MQQELIFDHSRDRYLLVETGWQNGDRIYGTFIHIDIIMKNYGFSTTALKTASPMS